MQKLGYKGAGVAVIVKVGGAKASDEKLKKDLGDYKILLGKRKYNPDKDKWSIPGGAMEEKDAESFLNCALREFTEELGWNPANFADNAKNIGKWKFCVPFFSWETHFFLIENKQLVLDQMIVKYINEFSEVKLIPLSEALESYPLARFVKEEINYFVKNL